MSHIIRTVAMPAAAFALLTAAAREGDQLRGYTAESSKIERNWPRAKDSGFPDCDTTSRQAGSP